MGSLLTYDEISEILLEHDKLCENYREYLYELKNDLQFRSITITEEFFILPLNLNEYISYKTDCWKSLDKWEKLSRSLIRRELSIYYSDPFECCFDAHEIQEELREFWIGSDDSVDFCLSGQADVQHINCVLRSLNNSVMRHEFFMFLLNQLNGNSRIRIWNDTPFWDIDGKYKMIKVKNIKDTIKHMLPYRKKIINKLIKQRRKIKLLKNVIL